LLSARMARWTMQQRWHCEKRRIFARNLKRSMLTLPRHSEKRSDEAISDQEHTRREIASLRSQ
jgi:hypothetical protein